MGKIPKVFKIAMFVILAVVLAFFGGPRAPEAELNALIEPYPLEKLTTFLQNEKEDKQIKPGNEAAVIWIDTPGVKTEYSLVYLHGFSASRGEGDPIHLEVAKRYRMNAYLARLDNHGMNKQEAMLELTPESLLESAKEAIAIGRLIGEKVIVMSCSTGSTLAIYLAASNPDWIDALICYSPNIDTYNQTTHLVDGPWGLHILRMVEGGKYHTWEASDAVQQYWSTSYRNEAIIDLRQLLDATMIPETFKKVTQPLLTLYYYKSEEEQDKVVSVSAMKEMFELISTPVSQKRIFSVPDAGHHVLASKYQSKDLETVRKYTFDFAEEVLGLQPSNND